MELGKTELVERLPKMDEDFKQILIDRFEAWELVELLQVPIEEIVELLEATIEEKIDDLEEIVGIGTDHEE